MAGHIRKWATGESYVVFGITWCWHKI